MTTPSQQRARSEEILEQLRDAWQDTQYARQKEHRISHWLRPFALRQAELETREETQRSRAETAETEVRRLDVLIHDAAAHWLKLEPGIPWEGAIDEAMRAAVAEIEHLRRSKAELEAKLTKAESAVVQAAEWNKAREAKFASVEGERDVFHEERDNAACRIAELVGQLNVAHEQLRQPKLPETLRERVISLLEKIASPHQTWEDEKASILRALRTPPAAEAAACEHEWVGSATGATHCLKCNEPAYSVATFDSGEEAKRLLKLTRETPGSVEWLAEVWRDGKRLRLIAEPDLVARLERLNAAVVQLANVVRERHGCSPVEDWGGPVGEIAREVQFRESGEPK